MFRHIFPLFVLISFAPLAHASVDPHERDDDGPSYDCATHSASIPFQETLHRTKFDVMSEVIAECQANAHTVAQECEANANCKPVTDVQTQ